MAEEETTDSKYVICPCCGKPTLPKPIKPKEELMEHWLACMVTATPFVHTYPLYNGKIYMTIVANSAETDGKLDTLASIFDSISARQDLMDMVQLNIPQLKAMSRICMHIQEVKLSTSSVNTRVFTPSTCVQAALDLLYPIRTDIIAGKKIENFQDTMNSVVKLLTSPENITSIPPNILAMTVETHSQLNNILMNTGFDKTFWEGIELA